MDFENLLNNLISQYLQIPYQNARRSFMIKNYKVAIVGATGVVGRTAIEILEKKDLPISDYVFFASKRSAGTTIEFKRKRIYYSRIKRRFF